MDLWGSSYAPPHPHSCLQSAAEPWILSVPHLQSAPHLHHTAIPLSHPRPPLLENSLSRPPQWPPCLQSGCQQTDRFEGDVDVGGILLRLGGRWPEQSKRLALHSHGENGRRKRRMTANPQRPTLPAPRPRGGSASDKLLPSDSGQATPAQSLRSSLAEHGFLPACGKGHTVGVYEAFARPCFCEDGEAQRPTEVRQ